jgi:ribosomal protein S27AE
MKKLICPTCSNGNFIALNTYKRVWHCCKQCGTAVSEQKKNYLLSWLPYADLKKGRHLDEEKMYDYFVEDIHIAWSENEGKEFIRDYLT